MTFELSKILNPEQYKAVIHIDGPLLIFAGAGSGKTRVITYRIYNMIANNGIQPRNILALTFTNKAAKEMKERVEKLTGFSYALTVSTFHSFGLKLLRYYGEAIGIKKNFVVYDDGDQEQLIKKILKKFNFDLKECKPSEYQEKINRHKDNLTKPGDLVKDYRMLLSEIEVYEEYEKIKAANNALDFSDLIMKCVELLKSPVSEEIKDRFKYLLVDEFQDTNFAQYKILKLLTQKHNNICVVGDDDQSIYSWRGAIMMNILNFEKDFKNTTIVKLERNYRSTQQILDFSNAIVKNNSTRSPKRLITDRKNGEQPVIKMLSDEYREAEFVISKIKELKNSGKYGYKDISIFFRTNLQSRVFEEKFRESNMPYILVGTASFYSRKEIKDLTAYLKLIVNPEDSVSLMRIINMPKRNIGDTTITKLTDYAAQNNISVFTLLTQPEKINFLNAGTIAKLTEFAQMIEKYIERAKNETVDTIITDLVEEIKYRDIMENSDDIRDNSRVGNIDEFINSACEFVRKSGNSIDDEDSEHEDEEFSVYDSDENATTAKFLEKITMFSETDKLADTRDYINMMTYHCAKGLEFPVVFMVGMEEEFLPHYSSIQNPENLEEERRLCYVGVTRAMNEIFFTHAYQRHKFGTLINPAVSRFILEAYPQYRPQLSVTRPNSSDMFQHFRKSFVRRGDSDFQPPKTQVRYSNSSEKKEESSGNRSKFRQGDKVLHPKFGPGKVIAVDEAGDKIKISFAVLGVKLLSLKLAKLTRMQ